jgi:hypothetical protein
MRREKAERIVDIRRNVTLAHGTVHKICDNTDIVKESAKSGTEEFVCVARLSQSYSNESYRKLQT